jgi:hypothetical protein
LTDPSLARPPGEITASEHRETGECRSCFGSGVVVQDAEYCAETGELVQTVVDCPVCGGQGSVSVYVYARRR